jgi:hypothetical protein
MLILGTDNVINAKHGGYEHVSEYIPIAQPTASTLAKLDELEPSETAGDRKSNPVSLSLSPVDLFLLF